jgi:hypothetical protein
MLASSCGFGERLTREIFPKNHRALWRSERVQGKARVSGNRNVLDAHEDYLIETRNAAMCPRSSRYQSTSSAKALV